MPINKKEREIINIRNWQEIHPDFTEEMQKGWEDRGFNYEECKEWIDAGLKPEDYDFCVWLKNCEVDKFGIKNGLDDFRKSHDENYLMI